MAEPKTEQANFERIAVCWCLKCNGRGRREYEDTPCPTCLGTGYRFHWLWRECEGKHPITHEEYGNLLYTLPCVDVGCTGYVLIEGKGERLLGLLQSLWSIGWHVEEWFDESICIVIDDERPTPPDSNRLHLGEGHGLEALAAAIVPALGGEHE